MENNIYYFLIYYFSGIICYKFIQGIFTTSRESIIYKELELSVLRIYRALDVDITTTMKYKYQTMKEIGVSNDDLLKVAKTDQIMLTKWRDSAIKKMLIESPGTVARLNRYRTWNEAMNALRKEEEK